MFKKIITYKDFNDRVQQEPIFLNISKTELTSLELDAEGGFANYILKMIECRNDKNDKELARLVKRLLLMSYGEISEDGKKFRKSSEISEDFEQSALFDKYYIDLLTDDKQLIEFLKGIMPALTAEQQKQVDAEVSEFMKDHTNASSDN